MINKLKNIKPKRNKEILLILILTVLLIVIFSLSGFLGIDQVEIDTEQSTSSGEVLVETDKAETKSTQSEEYSKSNRENTSNNLNYYHKETTESESVKGATKKSSVKPKLNVSETKDSSIQIVVLEIDTGTSSYSYDVSWQQDMNVHEVLSSVSESNNFSLKTKWYEGVESYYITELHGVGCCWVYKINGEGALGVSLETVEPGDVISWKHL